MVNKCSVSGCKSLYSKGDNVKVRLHRFPLSNPKTLPAWIAATCREEAWKPCKSSRLCGNHFENSEYIAGHGKNVLKATSVPTIEYRVDVLRHKRNKSQNCYDMEQTNESLKVQPVDSSDTSVEIVKLDYNDIYNLKNEHQNKSKNYDHGEPSHKNKNEICTTKNDHLHVIKLENGYNNGDDASYDDASHDDASHDDASHDDASHDDASHDDAIKNKYEDFNNELKNDICNRENQCYMFTSSFKEDAEPIVLTPPEEPLNMNINQTTADLNFKKIMDLKSKKRNLSTKNIYSLYFKALKKRRLRKQEKYQKSFNNDDADSFAAFIGAQMKALGPYRKVYLSAKHKIQKILMKAQLKITKKNV